MRVAYISPPYFSDVDFSYLPEAIKVNTIDYYIPLTPMIKSGGGIDIKQMTGPDGVNNIYIYPDIITVCSIVGLNSQGVFCVNNYGSKWYSFRSFWAGYKLYRHLKRERYDVIHLTEIPRINDIFLYLLRKRIVLTVHDPIPHSSEKSKMIRVSRKIAFRLLSNFIILNKKQKEEFIKVNRLEHKKVFESKLGVYSYKRFLEPTFSVQYPYILYFGQITSHKGVNLLLEAFKLVEKDHRGVKLVIAGKWKWNYDYSSFKEDDNYVFIDKFIPDGDLSSLIRNSLFVVVPYLDATQSGVVMSAFAFNKPCIATNVGGIPEMVADGERGIIIEPGRPQILADAISDLLDNPQKCELFSENIKSYYSSGPLSWKEIANSLSNVYKEVVSNM